MPKPADIDAVFIDNMKRLREQQGLSKAEFVRRLAAAGWDGVHQTTLSRLDNHERSLRLSEAVQVSAALGVPMAALMSDGGDPDAEQAVEQWRQSVDDKFVEIETLTANLVRAFASVPLTK